MPSDIHVLVRFQDQCVFAGEELTCTITFKNVLEAPESQRLASLPPQNSRSVSIGQIAAASRKSSVGQIDVHGQGPKSSRQPSHGSHQIATHTVRSPSIAGDESPNSAPEGHTQQRKASHKQQRSISIISGPSPVVSPNQTNFPPSSFPRPGAAHRRSSTVQIASSSSHAGQRRQSQYNSLGLHLQPQGGRRSPLSSTASSTPASASRQSTPDFQFPVRDQQSSSKASREPSPRPPNSKVPTSRGRRDVSTSSQIASERSSAEFCSLSTHSQETIMSEQPSVLSDRPQLPNARLLQHHRMPSQQAPRRPQAANLLMGYAHLNATFTVDGSLVDQSQFEEVKKKGFLGGQAGGGVVGVNKARPSSGFLGGFSFNSIGESLNSLVGGENMSSVKEMNAVTSSRAVPLLSTPQSLLFVDLHLEPGEEKSYSFSTTIPRGLPSSYRGKAIKISYNIQIGVQGIPSQHDTHKVRQISVPVRVFSGVDSDGGILGHDLMQPHVILQDLALVKTIDPTDEHSKPILSTNKKQGDAATFLTYIDNLLDRSRRRQSSSSYTLETLPSDPALNPTLQSIHRAIQLSNQTLSPSDSSSPSTNRFTISRATHPVATITLNRPLHLLGDAITAVIDFSSSSNAIPCAALHMTLETTETVSPSLAIRSEASIARVTRRVYAARSENCLFAKRVVFRADVPVGAAPTFLTSGVGLEWGVRFEFVVLKGERRDNEEEDGGSIDEGSGDAVDDDDGNADGGDTPNAAKDDNDDNESIPLSNSKVADTNRVGGDTDRNTNKDNNTSRHKIKPKPTQTQTQTQMTYPSLLETLLHDDRGSVNVALERFETETFDVRIPITVFGDVIEDGDGGGGGGGGHGSSGGSGREGGGGHGAGVEMAV